LLVVDDQDAADAGAGHVTQIVAGSARGSLPSR
jgi:hypothetical protein